MKINYETDLEGGVFKISRVGKRGIETVILPILDRFPESEATDEKLESFFQGGE